MRGWIGVDFDGTLAYYDQWEGDMTFGAPIPEMVEKVKRILEEGQVDVRIFTARVGSHADQAKEQQIRAALQSWCFQHIGRYLPITNEKDWACVEIWDDRAVQIVRNTGEFVGESQYA